MAGLEPSGDGVVVCHQHSDAAYVGRQNVHVLAGDGEKFFRDSICRQRPHTKHTESEPGPVQAGHIHSRRTPQLFLPTRVYQLLCWQPSAPAQPQGYARVCQVLHLHTKGQGGGRGQRKRKAARVKDGR
ncbi:hypothetical protein DPMN_126236 [Dreissena polymorpha]|uniref:Uncharacterized protein n=1 Tax=Dreissena polymorpha TaxID=45954 RepID=A0A9D4GZ54_DREPO|nr:hypothetical protein DPMN_126236 [Dreissena polymorpha]